MAFSSVPFIAFFLPAVFFICAALKNRTAWQNAVLLAASLFFYAHGDTFKVLLLLTCAWVSWYCAKKISETDMEASRKKWMLLGILANVGMLVICKYTGFLADTINVVFGLHLPVPRFALPLGISFFTFQAVSFVVDIKRDKHAVPPDFFTVLLYLSLFPQLIAGPIVRWDTVCEQFKKRKMGFDNAVSGLCRFAVGLAKKVLLADVLAQVADSAFAAAPLQTDTAFLWFGAISYMLQIYLDFSGYSDMALGIGEMFGFSLPENFNRPLAARSMRMFWRRWHMTLTAWFAQYVYIPLGGSRAGQARTCLNIGIVFLLTGIWHGADWSFLIWGMLNGTLVLLERAPFFKVEKWPKTLSHLYTLLMVMMGFVIFRAENLTHALNYFQGLFAFQANAQQWMLSLSPLNILSFGAAAVTAILPRRKYPPSLCFILLVLALMSIAAAGYHPFIYFRF